MVDSIAAGSADALADAYSEHAEGVFEFSRSILKSRVLAEDVVQDVFVRFWNHAERFDAARGSLRSYLITLTYGRSIDIVRSESARRRRETRDCELSTAARQPDGLDEQVVNDETVHSAVDELQDTERIAVSLAYFGEHSYREVAALLDVPEGTVKTRIRAGLARLRGDLSEQVVCT